MSMFIARIANKLGNTNYAMKEAIKNHGKVYGETSKSGLRAFKMKDGGKEVVTVLNKDFTPHSKMIISSDNYGKERIFERKYMYMYPTYDATSIMKRTKMPDGSINCEHIRITPKDYGNNQNYEKWITNIVPAKK